MADIVITPSNVVPANLNNAIQANAKVAINAGQFIRVDSDGGLVLAAKDTSDNANAAGIAVNSAAVGQPVTYLRTGEIAVGSVLTQAATYVLSSGGSMSPQADLATGELLTFCGYAKDASTLVLMLTPTGVAQP